ncbi:hypothetical protein ABFS83_06G001500 [Erythranthe nasuta]
MQTALSSSSSSSLTTTRGSLLSIIMNNNSPPPKLQLLPASISKTCRFASIRSNAQSVNYSSPISVFPAEACETVGGEACLADIGPEVKLEPAQTNTPKKTASEPIDREYLDYTQDSRTVLLGEACEVLGGDFCEPPYPK